MAVDEISIVDNKNSVAQTLRGLHPKPSSVIAERQEHTEHTELNDSELARGLQVSQALLVAGGLIRSRYHPGGEAHRHALVTTRLQRRCRSDVPDDEGAFRHGARRGDPLVIPGPPFRRHRAARSGRWPLLRWGTAIRGCPRTFVGHAPRRRPRRSWRIDRNPLSLH